MSPDTIREYHAHIYYHPETTRAEAARLRDAIAAEFPEARLGRWHDVPIGPHTQAMYQVAFAPELFARFVPWLMLRHGSLDVLLHPETGHDRTDHTLHAAWLGNRLAIREDVLSDGPT